MKVGRYALYMLVMLLLLLVAFSAIAESPVKKEAAKEEPDKLKKHREAVKSGLRTRRYATGQVTLVEHNDQIFTDITEDLLQQAKIEYSDQVTVRVKDKVLTIRVFGPQEYKRIIEHQGASDVLDVDIVGIVGPHQPLVIIGLGGGLAQWVDAQKGNQVVVEKTFFE